MDLITIVEAAAELRVTESYVRRLCRTEVLDGRKMGQRLWLVKKNSVAKYLKNKGKLKSA